MRGKKPRVALKYCGSCNPYIDFATLKTRLIELQEELGFELAPFFETEIDVVVILCGCPRACANREEVRAVAKKSLVVSGYNIAGKPAPEEGLSAALKIELAAVLDSL